MMTYLFTASEGLIIACLSISIVGRHWNICQLLLCAICVKCLLLSKVFAILSECKFLNPLLLMYNYISNGIMAFILRCRIADMGNEHFTHLSPTEGQTFQE